MTMPQQVKTPLQNAQDEVTQKRLNGAQIEDPFWKQQLDKQRQTQQKQTQIVANPAQAVSQDAFSNQIKAINDTGAIQNQAVTGSLNTAKARQDTIALKKWQDQQAQAYKDLQTQYQTMAKGLITQPNTTTPNYGNSCYSWNWRSNGSSR